MSNQYLRVMVLLPLLFATLFSCASQEATIYKKGRKWTYNCTFYDTRNAVVDSFSIKMEVKNNRVALLSGQIPIVYNYNDNLEIIEELTGVIEEEDEISIHQPRLGKMNFTAILPMPSVRKPFEGISESEVETKIVKSSFPELNGKVVKQQKKTLGEATWIFKGEEIKCYLSEAKNTNLIEEFGQYSYKLWFNEKYGFVKYEYTKPDSTKVIIELSSMTE